MLWWIDADDDNDGHLIRGSDDRDIDADLQRSGVGDKHRCGRKWRWPEVSRSCHGSALRGGAYCMVSLVASKKCLA